MNPLGFLKFAHYPRSDIKSVTRHKRRLPIRIGLIPSGPLSRLDHERSVCGDLERIRAASAVGITTGKSSFNILFDRAFIMIPFNSLVMIAL